MKICYTCKETKSLNDYHKHPQKIDGKHPSCKSCRKVKTHQNYEKHKETICKKTQAYYEKNKKHLLDKQREYCEIKRQTDMKYVVSRRLRNRLYYALKKKSWKKNTHFAEYIGCTKDELLLHLETQFKPGMSWDNYGKWHIDHIIPLSISSTAEEMYKLCHYTNLQPLWAKDNIQKNDKLMPANVKEYTVRQIDPKLSHDLILTKHYSKRLPVISYCYGLFKNDILMGVCTFSKPSSPHVAGYISTTPDKVLELNRLVLVYNIKNEASILVSKALKLLPKSAIVVSFADTKQNHIGYVYQACNFKYYGTTLPRREFQSAVNKHSSTLAKDPKKYNAKLGDRSLKHRYIYAKDYMSIKLEEAVYPKT